MIQPNTPRDNNCCCNDCKFYKPKPEYGNKRHSVGQCRESSPTNSNHHHQQLWPLISNDEWCGKFKRITNNKGGDVSKVKIDPLGVYVNPEESHKFGVSPV